MSRLRRWFGRGATPRIRVHVLIKGRIGEGWLDIDRKLSLGSGATLRDLLALAEREQIPLRDAIDRSPHLRHTLMLNGERCEVEANLDRVLQDGDQIYLLAPLAGG